MLSPTQADREVAVQLINVYFELFKEILGRGSDPIEKDNVDTDAKGEKRENNAGVEKEKVRTMAKAKIKARQKRKGLRRSKMRTRG